MKNKNKTRTERLIRLALLGFASTMCMLGMLSSSSVIPYSMTIDGSFSLLWSTVMILNVMILTQDD